MANSADSKTTILLMKRNLKLYNKKILFYLALKSNLRRFYILDI